jgi:hypothetical protein
MWSALRKLGRLANVHDEENRNEFELSLQVTHDLQ